MLGFSRGLPFIEKQDEYRIAVLRPRNALGLAPHHR